MMERALQLDRHLDSAGYRTKAEWAYLQLRRWIQSGALEAEQRLDQEELAARLGVSRVPLRQALVRLQADGLVVGRPHIGASVAPLSLAHAEDIYAGRCALEPMLAEAAVLRLNEETLRDLNRLLDEQQGALEKRERPFFLELDRRFHRRLYDESGYRTSVELAQRLRDLSDRYIGAFQGDTERSQSALLEHREIVRACASRDAAQAARLIKEHVQRGIVFLRKASRNTEGDASRRPLRAG